MPLLFAVLVGRLSGGNTQEEVFMTVTQAGQLW